MLLCHLLPTVSTVRENVLQQVVEEVKERRWKDPPVGVQYVVSRYEESLVMSWVCSLL